MKISVGYQRKPRKVGLDIGKRVERILEGRNQGRCVLGDNGAVEWRGSGGEVGVRIMRMPMRRRKVGQD